MALTPEEQIEMESLQAGGPSGGPAEPFSDTAKRVTGNTFGVLGKLADALRANTTGPLTGSILEGLSGKKVYSGQDVANADTPVDLKTMSPNLKTFPSNSQMFARAGIKNPSLSDALPSLYAKPGSQHPMYQPEKGGMLDPSAAGALQVATDPASWLGGEATSATGTALRDAAQSTAGPISKAFSMAMGPVTAGRTAVADTLGPAGQVLGAVTNPLSALTKLVGKSIYGANLEKVEHEGQLYGKEGIQDTFYRAGVKTPGQLAPKGQAAADALEKTRGTLFDQAANEGATVPMGPAMQPGMAKVARLRATGLPSDAAAADALEHELSGPLAQERGVPPTPGTPAGQPTTSTVQSSLVDEYGQPFEQSVVTPGTPGTPGSPGVAPRPYTPQAASDLKSSMTKSLTNQAYKVGGKVAPDAEGVKAAAGGLREGIEDSVGQALGPQAGADVSELNQNLGNILGTQKAQASTEYGWKKLLNKTVRMTGADAVTAGIGTAAGGPLGGLTALGLKKLLQTSDVTSMPVGYGLRSLGDSNLADRLNALLADIQAQKGKQNGQNTGR